MPREVTHTMVGQQTLLPSNYTNAPTRVRVVDIDPHTDRRWKNFVRNHPDGLVYHHPEWLQIVEHMTDGLTPAHLACEDEAGNLRGVLPLFWRSGLLTGTSLSSIPYTRLAGPITDTRETGEMLIDAALRQIDSDSGARLKIKCLGSQLDEVHKKLRGGPWIENFILDLPEAGKLMDTFSSRRRQKIRRVLRNADKDRIRVRAANRIEELETWYQLYLQAMRKNRAMPRPWQFFELVWDLLRPAGLMQLSLAEQQHDGGSEIIAGSLEFYGTQTVTGAYRGRSEKALHVEAHDLLTFQSIADACNAGFKRFDMGEASAQQPGLQQYKTKWGCKPHLINRYYYPEEGEIDSEPMANERILGRLAGIVWGRLPLKASATVSQVLHRYL